MSYCGILCDVRRNPRKAFAASFTLSSAIRVQGPSFPIALYVKETFGLTALNSTLYKFPVLPACLISSIFSMFYFSLQPAIQQVLNSLVLEHGFYYVFFDNIIYVKMKISDDDI